MTTITGAVLGAGVTGLAAGTRCGWPVYEAAATPGGLCGSYYVQPDGRRLAGPPADGDAYRFELGGGHWIFGGAADTLAWIEALAPCRTYQRRASVELDGRGGRVGYPLQHHLADLGPKVAATVVAEIEQAAGRSDPSGAGSTMREWLTGQFGPTLADLFFDDFHERYTAGLWTAIAPQDPAKSPLSMDAVRAGARGRSDDSGYNQTFRYPVDGLDALVGALAAQADVRYDRAVVAIDTASRALTFANGSTVSYSYLLSTLPLPVALGLAGVVLDAPADPHTSVLVVNVGGEPGPRLGDDHWVFVPHSRSGFHRFGVYSNVDPSFLPTSARSVDGRPARRASLYVERAFPGGQRPSPTDEAAIAAAMVEELQERGVLGAVEVVDPTWIEVAYTWSWPGSTWRAEALAALAALGVQQIGRYGRWAFQGIADSIAEGAAAGAGAPDRGA